MKVIDLIERLQEYDPMNEVLVVDNDGASYDILDIENDADFLFIEIDA